LILFDEFKIYYKAIITLIMYALVMIN